MIENSDKKFKTNIGYIPLSEAAEFLNTSRDYMNVLVRRGKLRAVKLGRNWVTTKEWVAEYCDSLNISKFKNLSTSRLHQDYGVQAEFKDFPPKVIRLRESQTREADQPQAENILRFKDLKISEIEAEEKNDFANLRRQFVFESEVAGKLEKIESKILTLEQSKPQSATDSFFTAREKLLQERAILASEIKLSPRQLLAVEKAAVLDSAKERKFRAVDSASFVKASRQLGIFKSLKTWPRLKLVAASGLITILLIASLFSVAEFQNLNISRFKDFNISNQNLQAVVFSDIFSGFPKDVPDFSKWLISLFRSVPSSGLAIGELETGPSKIAKPSETLSRIDSFADAEALDAGFAEEMFATTPGGLGTTTPGFVVFEDRLLAVEAALNDQIDFLRSGLSLQKKTILGTLETLIGISKLLPPHPISTIVVQGQPSTPTSYAISASVATGFDRLSANYLNLSNNAIINGSLTVKSGGTFDSLSVSGAASVSTLTVSGVSTLTDLTVNGTVNIPGSAVLGSVQTPLIWNSGTLTASTTGANPLIFATNSSERMRIDSNGKIGVGTTSPASIFEIYGTDALRIPVGTTVQRPVTMLIGQMRYNTNTHQFEGFGDNSVWQGLGGVIDADQDTYIIADTNNADEDYLRFFTFGTERMTITNTGNVGIGTTSPQTKLEVTNTSSGATADQLYLTNLASATSTASRLTFRTSDISGATGTSTAAITGILTQNWTTGKGDLAFSTLRSGALTEAMRITDAGYVGIGTTTPTQALTVQGNTFLYGGLGVGLATTTSGAIQTSGDVFVGRNLYVSGNSTVLGGSLTDTLTVNSSINSNLVPNQNNFYNLGSPAFYWSNLYVDTINANNISGASTTISGTKSNDFTINTDNASVDQESMNLIFYRGTVPPNAVIAWDAATSSKHFNFNQSVYIFNQSASTTNPVLTVQGNTGLTANLFQVLDVSTSTTLFSVNPISQKTTMVNASTTYLTVSSSLWTTNGTITNASTTNLTVSGNLWTGASSFLTIGGNLLLPDGSVSSPSLAFTGDTDTGLFRLGDNKMGFATGATTSLVLDSGKVIVGNAISTASYQLEVNNRDAFNNAIVDELRLTHFTTGTANDGLGAGILFYGQDVTGSGQNMARIASQVEHATSTDPGGFLANLTFYTVGGGGLLEKMRLTGNGQLLLATTTVPTGYGANIATSTYIFGKLTVGTGTLDLLSGNIISDSGQFNITNAANTAMTFSTNNSERVRIDSSGNVGIGSTTPSAVLSVNVSNAAGPTPALNITNATGSILFANSAGNVGLGTTNPNEQLEITGNLRLPATTATVGIIKSGANRLLHTFGTDSFFVGINAGNLTLTSSEGKNIGVGNGALTSITTANRLTAVGYNALTADTSGSNNTALGDRALAANIIGSSNTAVGSIALAGNTGSSNTAVGFETLQSNTSGGDNTAVGSDSLANNIAGSQNTAVGIYSLLNTTNSNNVAVGRNAGRANTTGSTNTFIGAQADDNFGLSAVGLTNATAIGYNAVVTQSNTLILGNGANVGIGTTTPTSARTVIQGADTSSTAAALNVTDSAGISKLYVRNDGYVGIGAVPSIASSEMLLQIGDALTSGVGLSGMRMFLSAANAPIGSQGNSQGNLVVMTTDSFAIDIGGSIGLGGKYNTTGNTFPFGNIAGRKENSTDGNGNGYLQFATMIHGGVPTERMRITSSGNVGIGTTTPNNLLTLFNSTTPALGFTTGSGDSAWTMGIDTADQNKFKIASSTAVGTNARLTIDGNGNVGIGTTGPLSKLDVNGGVAIGTYAGVNAAPSNGIIVSGQVSIGTTITTGYGLIVAGAFRTDTSVEIRGTGSLDFSNVALPKIYTGSTALTFWNSAVTTELMRIQNGGNVGIGTSTGLFARTTIAGSDSTSNNAALSVINSASTSLLFVRNDGKVGIGLTTPAALLQIKGATGVSQDALALQASTANGDYISLSFLDTDGTTQRGAVRSIQGASVIQLFGGTTEVIDARETGVFIGTGDPLNKLDVNGGVAIGTYAGVNTAPSNGLIVSGNVGIGTTTPNNLLTLFKSTTPALGFTTGSGDSAWTMGIDTADANKFKIASSTAVGTNARLTIDGNGNVGIGTAIPLALLDVNGVSAASLGAVGAPGFAFRTDLDTGMYSTAANTLLFSTGGLERVRIKDDGKVSIGGLVPSTMLHVSESSGGAISNTLRISNIDNSINSGVGIEFTHQNANDYKWRIASQATAGNPNPLNPAMVFSVDNGAGSYTEKVRIDYSGAVGIGTTTFPLGYGMNIATSTYIFGKLTVGTGTLSFLSGNIISDSGQFNITNSANTAMTFSTNNSERMRIDSSGNVGIGTTTPGNGAVFAVAGKIYSGTTGGGFYFPDGTLQTTAAGGNPMGYISGLVLSNDGTDATNDIDIAAGTARNDDNTADMTTTSTLIKQLDAAWAVGTNQGGLDTGTIANTTYHVWLIKRSDTGIVDALFSTSATAPTMPTNYDKKRRIGSIIRSGATILAFIQDGDLFQLKSAIQDLDSGPGGTVAVSRTLSVPTGINVIARFAVANATNATYPVYAIFSDLATTDNAASATNFNFSFGASGTFNISFSVMLEIRTNTSAQVRMRADTDAGTYKIITHGWIDTRGGAGVFSGVGTASAGTAGQIPYFASAGNSLTATSTIFLLNGNVGIGTTNPLGKLNIRSGVSGAASAVTEGDDLVIENNGDVGLSLLSPDANRQYIFFGDASDNQRGYIKYHGQSFATVADRDKMIFRTASVDRVSIDNSGNVGIGTTTPSTILQVVGGGPQLNVKGGTQGTAELAAMKFQDESWDWEVGINRVGNDFFHIAQGTTAKFVIDASGRTAISTFGTQTGTSLCYNTTDNSGYNTITNCSSLRALKDNIQPLNLGLETLMQLKPVTYNWKSNGEADLGFIAEDVYAVNPLLASYYKGELSGVRYEHLTALLTKAIQEQQEQISFLASTTLDLKSRIANLELLIATSTLQAQGGTIDLMAISNDLNLDGHSLLNVKSITGMNGLWKIDENGNITAQSVNTQALTVGGGAASGVTIYDRETTAPKCIYIEGGVIKTSDGACGATANSGTEAVIQQTIATTTVVMDTTATTTPEIIPTATTTPDIVPASEPVIVSTTTPETATTTP